MELIKISPSQLKIMLTSEDMDRFDLDCISAENNTSKARKAFRNILAEAKVMSGFDAGNDKVFIQLYPSKQGGCELYISKTEFLSDDTLKGEEYEYTPEKQEGNRTDGYFAWRFGTIQGLISACKKLKYTNFSVSNSYLWIDENNRYHMIFKISDGNGAIDEHIGTVISEYGDSENYDTFLIYIDEHGKRLRDNDALEILSDL